MIQIYFYKKNFDAQKAERWFKERRIPFQAVDLARARIGLRELESVRAAVGLDAMIDKEGRPWKECPARYAAGEEAVLVALAEDPRRLKLPIVRSGKLAATGYRPEQWETWEI